MDETTNEHAHRFLRDLVNAVMGEAKIPANRILDRDYIYDELGSQVGCAVNDALAYLRNAE